MNEQQRAPGANEWGAVMDGLHAVANMITVRSHYTGGHPAIAQADDNASNTLARVLESMPDLVVALVDNEFIVCERPLPDLRQRLHSLAESMLRHDVECIVFQRGMTRQEAGILGTALAAGAGVAGNVREQTQSELMHVLLRFVVRAGDAAAGSGTTISFFVPPVHDALVGVARALASESPIDKLGLLAVANQVVLAVTARTAMITQRSWTRSMDDEATHATNVAIMTAALAVDANYPQRVCIDVTAAAIVHDIGHLFLPEEMRGVPEPLLDDRAKAVFRNHTFAGAAMLLGAGCSPLWVAGAFEHHRGVDAGGYPTLDTAQGPHELVRMIALANYFDSKRTRIHGQGSSPDEALRGAMDLEARYFGPGLVRRFLRVLGVFPPGTAVELSNQEPAVVTRANPTDPWRPQVKILRGPNAARIVELREMNSDEGRHRLSIVRAISPPMLVLADAVVVAPVVVQEVVPEESFYESKAAAPVEATARDAQDRARASLGGMGEILDALLTVPTEALVSAMPPAPSIAPRAMAMSIPPLVAPSPIVSRPPPKSMPPVMPAPLPSHMRPAPLITHAPPPPRSPSSSSAPPPPLVITSAPPSMARPAGPSKNPPLVTTRPAPLTRPPSPSQPRPSSRSPGPMPARSSASSASSASPNDPREAERALLERLGPVTAVPVLVADVTKLNLDHRAAFVLRFLDGMSTVEDILDASGLPRVEALTILVDLLDHRVIALTRK